MEKNLPHQPSSESSVQSTLPSQKYELGRQVPSPQASVLSLQSPFSNNGLGGWCSVKFEFYFKIIDGN